MSNTSIGDDMIDLVTAPIYGAFKKICNIEEDFESSEESKKALSEEDAATLDELNTLSDELGEEIIKGLESKYVLVDKDAWEKFLELKDEIERHEGYRRK